MDADPGDVIAASLHFTAVQTDAHFQAELAGAFAQGDPTLNRTPRAVEGGKNAITGALDLSTAEAMNLAPRHTVVVVEQLTPATIACPGRVSSSIASMPLPDEVAVLLETPVPIRRGHVARSS